MKKGRSETPYSYDGTDSPILSWSDDVCVLILVMDDPLRGK